jgi:hypothetical protein
MQISVVLAKLFVVKNLQTAQETLIKTNFWYIFAIRDRTVLFDKVGNQLRYCVYLWCY